MASEYISSDIVSILLFVSPGFLTIALVGKFYGIAIKMEQFERTAWSLITSVPIGILFFYLNGISKIDAFLEFFISHPFLSLFEIGIISVILAIVVSLIFKYNILEKISKLFIYTSDDRILTDLAVWDRFMLKNFKKPVIVKTQELEYKGWLSSNSIRDEKREIVLDQPVIVYIDENGNSADFPSGKQIILFGDDIKSITVLGEKSSQS